jgi:hypothetical protein
MMISPYYFGPPVMIDPLHRRLKNRGRSVNQSDGREPGFNRPRFLNYKTRAIDGVSCREKRILWET